MPYTLPWKDYSYSTNLLIQLLHVCILKDNRLSTFQPEATSHQQKLWFDIFALCFWLLRDTAVLGSAWHLAPAATVLQAVKLLRTAHWEGQNNSEFQRATLQGQNPSSTTLVAHEACCLFTSGLDHAQPLCQSYSCLPLAQNFSPCRSKIDWVTAAQSRTALPPVRHLCSWLEIATSPFYAAKWFICSKLLDFSSRGGTFRWIQPLQLRSSGMERAIKM